jgi:hypothetical protein
MVNEYQDKKIELDKRSQEIKEELSKSFKAYRKTISYMASDAPIGILLLPKDIEKVLLDNGFLRVYDLLDMDFTKVKGLHASAIVKLESRLNQFLAML